MTYTVFPSKVLLFGEHFLLRGATALCVPLRRYSGHWAWAKPEKARSLQGNLRHFADSEALRSVPGLDSGAFFSELDRGLWFRSNIPSGYGLGSSGVLTAATYHRYCREKTTNLPVLKAQLAQMEGFFHGKSSGIDPLTSYLAAPVLVRHRTETEKTACPDWSNDFKIYLLDSRQARKTGPLVQRFQQMADSPAFSDRLDDFLADVHEPMLGAFVEGRFAEFWEHLGQVSLFQWQEMRFMLPETVHERWGKGLAQGDFFLKICGAGGGGFMLLFVKNKEAAAFLERVHRLIEIAPF